MPRNVHPNYNNMYNVRSVCYLCSSKIHQLPNSHNTTVHNELEVIFFNMEINNTVCMQIYHAIIKDYLFITMSSSRFNTRTCFHYHVAFSLSVFLFLRWLFPRGRVLFSKILSVRVDNLSWRRCLIRQVL